MGMRTEEQKIAHLLRRFAFGASEAEMEYYSPGGLSGAINRLLNYTSVDEGFPIKPEDFQNDQGNLNLRAAQVWWYFRLVGTSHPLEQKMTIFWHDHFATSAQKVDSPYAMLGHIDALRSHAVGPFQDLLLAVSKDPGMLYWLDNHENVKGKPNENFAREIMELFTLGIGHYSEKDVQEAARAFTGWTIGVRRGQRVVPAGMRIPPRGPQFLYIPARHDDGEKTILGNRGTFNGEDVVGILVGNPQTARYITKKLWEWFVYPNPEPKMIEDLAMKWRNSGMVIKDILRWIMESPEFYSDRAYRAVIKNPADFVIPIMRQIGLGQAAVNRLQTNPGIRGAGGLLAPLVTSTKAMGMELMYPPDVDGWVSGQSWISTATMVERIKFANVVFPPRQGGNPLMPAFPLFAENPTSRGVVDRLISLFDAEFAEEKIVQLVEAADKVCNNRVDNRNASPTANAVARLMFGAPEFQFC